MKLNKSELRVTPDDMGEFYAHINESGSHMHPAWKFLRHGGMQELMEYIFERTDRIKNIKIIITYEHQGNHRR